MGERSRNHCRDTSCPRENTASISELKLFNSQTFSWGSLEGWFRHSYVHNGRRNVEGTGNRRESMLVRRPKEPAVQGARLLFYNILCM